MSVLSFSPRRPPLSRSHPLLGPASATWLTFTGLGVLMYSPALRVYRAGELPANVFISKSAYALAPNALLEAPRGSGLGIIVTILYVLLVLAALASWIWAMRTARGLSQPSTSTLLVLTGLLCTPALAFVGLLSDDVFLYNLYGRTISLYGANPLLHAPSSFPWDPHLQWVYWKDLPSAYGPIWLMLSGVLSALSDGVTSVVLAYRCAGLAAHLATTLVLWRTLRQVASREALPATLFYAWNPLIIFEVVANAHNDGVVALLAVLLIAATLQRSWALAAFFAACAVMVKPFAAVLLPALALRIFQTSATTRAWLRQTAIALAAGTATLLLVSLPLAGGTELLANIRTNPASHMYANTMWELISDGARAAFHIDTTRVQHPYLDAVRTAAFMLGMLWLFTRRWTRRGAAHVAVPMWLLFLLTASWVWPWYFVPMIALAALARGVTNLAAAFAATAGGMLFWVGWPAPSTIPGLYAARAAILFGPMLVVLAWPPLRARIIGLLFGGIPHALDETVRPLPSTRPATSVGGGPQPSSATATS